jgi:hypothetical protein
LCLRFSYSRAGGHDVRASEDRVSGLCGGTGYVVGLDDSRGGCEIGAGVLSLVEGSAVHVGSLGVLLEGYSSRL